MAVTTADAKAHLKVDHATDDAYIADLVLAAVGEIEAYTNRTIIATTFNFYLSSFPDVITLQTSPVSAVSTIKYYDDSNNIQTWADTNYWFNISEEPMQINYTNKLSTYTERGMSVDVEFIAGYADADAVPRPLRQAILLLVADMYENREDKPRERFSMWKMLCTPFRVFYSDTENG